MNILFGLLLIIIMYSTSGADGFVTRTIREVSLPEQTAFQAGDTIVKLDGYGTLNYTDINFAISNIESETTTATVLRTGSGFGWTTFLYQNGKRLQARRQ